MSIHTHTHTLLYSTPLFIPSSKYSKMIIIDCPNVITQTLQLLDPLWSCWNEKIFLPISSYRSWFRHTWDWSSNTLLFVGSNVLNFKGNMKFPSSLKMHPMATKSCQGKLRHSNAYHGPPYNGHIIWDSDSMQLWKVRESPPKHCEWPTWLLSMYDKAFRPIFPSASSNPKVVVFKARGVNGGWHRVAKSSQWAWGFILTLKYLWEHAISYELVDIRLLLNNDKEWVNHSWNLGLSILFELKSSQEVCARFFLKHARFLHWDANVEGFKDHRGIWSLWVIGCESSCPKGAKNYNFKTCVKQYHDFHHLRELVDRPPYG